MIRIAVLIASYNRREVTLRCMRSLHTSLSAIDSHVDARVFHVDASSNDETSASVAKAFRNVTTIRVSSETYWAESMRIAYVAAHAWKPEVFLWLNDDVVLDLDGLRRMHEEFLRNPNRFLVGSMRDPLSGAVTYSGRVAGPWWNRLDATPVFPQEPWSAVDLANGNAVWVSHEIDQAIGGFPLGYRHALADFAYSLRARRRGIDVNVLFPPIGTCALNPRWEEGYSGLSWIPRVRRAMSPKGAPLASWAKYVLEFGGVAAPMYLVRPYFGALRRRRARK